MHCLPDASRWLWPSRVRQCNKWHLRRWWHVSARSSREEPPKALFARFNLPTGTCERQTMPRMAPPPHVVLPALSTRTYKFGGRLERKNPKFEIRNSKFRIPLYTEPMTENETTPDSCAECGGTGWVLTAFCLGLLVSIDRRADRFETADSAPQTWGRLRLA